MLAGGPGVQSHIHRHTHTQKTEKWLRKNKSKNNNRAKKRQLYGSYTHFSPMTISHFTHNKIIAN
jgi:hypothetical protein